MENHGRAGVAVEWLKGSGNVLDLGCAEGHFARLASDHGWQVIGMDVDMDSLSKAKGGAPKADFAMGSGEFLPFADESFNRVVMLDVLEHIPSEQLTLREVERVLKPGGTLVISVPHKGTFGFIDAQNSRIFAAGRKIIKGRENGLHHRHYTLSAIQELLGNRFRLSRTRYGGYLAFPVLGYILMFTDSLPLKEISASLRRIEQIDFDKDRGERSWHLMAEFIKE